MEFFSCFIGPLLESCTEYWFADMMRLHTLSDARWLSASGPLAGHGGEGRVSTNRCGWKILSNKRIEPNRSAAEASLRGRRHSSQPWEGRLRPGIIAGFPVFIVRPGTPASSTFQKCGILSIPYIIMHDFRYFHAV